MIAAIHAGWKGAYKGIVKKVINHMLKKVAIERTLQLLLDHQLLKKIMK